MPTRHTMLRCVGVVFPIAMCICGCTSQPPARKPEPPPEPIVMQPLPVKYPEEQTRWNTSAPVMLFSTEEFPYSVTFAEALKPALTSRGYTLIDRPFDESDWMSAALRTKAKLIIPQTHIMQDGPVSGEEVTEICQQILVVDAGDNPIVEGPRIRTFHVWARQEKEKALMKALVHNLMCMPAFRSALEPAQIEN